MSVIVQYRAFAAGLAGYLDVTFNEFRYQILPLLPKKVWSASETDLVQGYIGGGAGFALQQLFGVEHPALSQLLGSDKLEPEQVSAAELHARMGKFGAACRLRHASPLWYIAAQATLHSSDYKFDMKDTEALFPGLGGFADEYRAGSSIYKKVIDRHFAMLACEAPYITQEWFQPVIDALDLTKSPPVVLGEKYPWSKHFLLLGKRRELQFRETLQECVRATAAAFQSAERIRISRESAALKESAPHDETTPLGHRSEASRKKKAKKRAQKAAQKAAQKTLLTAATTTAATTTAATTTTTCTTTETASTALNEPLPEWAQHICQLMEADAEGTH
jgi:hypothetical protein